MRNATKALTALSAVLFVIPISDAAAQRRRGLIDVSPAHERHGFWINLGLAAGAENYRYTNSDGCNGVIGAYQCDNNIKPTFTVALGGTVNPSFRLGGELNAWVYEHNHADFGRTTSYLVGGLLTGQFYPARRMGLFAKGGLGISRSGESYELIADAGETGFAYLLGAGYEVRLSRSLFLTPAISLMHHVSTNPDDPDNFGSFHERLWSFGVGLTIQPGR